MKRRDERTRWSVVDVWGACIKNDSHVYWMCSDAHTHRIRELAWVSLFRMFGIVWNFEDEETAAGRMLNSHPSLKIRLRGDKRLGLFSLWSRIPSAPTCKTLLSMQLFFFLCLQSTRCSKSVLLPTQLNRGRGVWTTHPLWCRPSGLYSTFLPHQTTIWLDPGRDIFQRFLLETLLVIPDVCMAYYTSIPNETHVQSNPLQCFSQLLCRLN